MSELTNTRWGVWFRFVCGGLAVLLCCIPLFDQTAKLVDIHTQWDQPSNYFLSAISVGILGLLAPHWAMKSGALKLARLLGVLLCLTAVLAATLLLIITGAVSMAISL
jgi:hypothetical protein